MTTTIRRTLSPVPKPIVESHSVGVGSPLSKCYTPTTTTDTSSFASSPLYHFPTFILNLFSKTSSKQKPKPNALTLTWSWIWRRSFFHFFVCFLVGVFVGFTPIVSIKTSTNIIMSRNQNQYQLYDSDVNHVMLTTTLVANNDSSNNESNTHMIDGKQENVTSERGDGLGDSKLLMIVTTTPTRGYYLNRLAHTLRLVDPPLLWLVVEMTSQSGETAELLRKSGVMYRHLVCTKNLTEVKDPRVHQRNVALSHIEMHRLDGIVYFADDSNIYSTQLFHHMRQIRRFGTWQVAKLKKSTRVASFVGPICNGTQVTGWHTNNVMRRFHADLSGFAFNSTILWDPEKWHRPSLQPIRHLDIIKDGFQASAFIEQVVEDETEMEGLPADCSEVLAWHMEIDQLSSFNATILSPLI